jgi:hypothetical protein
MCFVSLFDNPVSNEIKRKMAERILQINDEEETEKKKNIC